MSTPTTSQHTPQQPGSASKKAAGHVTTPSHLGLASPAPRSVPSPAATRKDQAGKTPVNHPTAGSSGSKTLGGTPMVHNLSQTGMTVSSSPGAHNVTPSALAGLGLDLGSTTPGQLSNLLAGGAAMMPTMSDLGLGSRGGKRNEDEERRDKMRRVLKNIGRRKGRVSQDAIARIGRRVGLDIDADADSAEERARTMGNRALAIAGSYSLVEVSLKQHVPQRVDVMITGEGSDLEEFGNAAGKLLLSDLQVPDGLLLHSNLDRFARNLNRLARLDILSKTGKVNCFQAICGMYKSLKKLYDLEVEAVKQQQGEGQSIDDAKAKDEVLRKRSGRPAIHGNERIGLALEYWTAAKSANKQDDSAMEIDGETSQTSKSSQSDVYKLQIEAEASPAPMLSALRVSDAWLPDTFEIPTPESGETIPWQDPPPTYVTDSTTDGNGIVTAVDGTERPPDLRFAAKLDPPVVMPWSMVTMLSEVGIELPQIGQVGDYYDALLSMDTNTMAARHQSIEAEQLVLSIQDDGAEVDVPHRYVLEIPKPDHGHRLEKLYFSHPRQLVSLLPILRQWAQVGALVHSAFGNGTPLPNGHVESLHVPVTIGLSALPQPTFSVTLPASANTVFQILPNAGVAVTNHDGDEEAAKTMARALEVCGDLGVWVEWMRRRQQ